MIWIMSKIAGIGDYLIRLSPRTRMQLVVVGLLLLGGGATYKLINSIRQLQQPLPAVRPAQLIKPMEGLVRQTSANISDYRIERNKSLRRLDSLRTLNSTKNNNYR